MNSSVPRRDATPLVTAESAFPEGVWLSGDVQLYRDGSFIGSTYWNTQARERLAKLQSGKVKLHAGNLDTVVAQRGACLDE